MLSAQNIIELADMRQREAYVAVRISALILKNSGSIGEKSAKAQFKLNDLIWGEVRLALKSIFKFANGRIDFYDSSDRPAPWDLLTEDDIAKIDRDVQKQKEKEEIPLTSVQQTLFDLGGFKKSEAKSFYFAMSRTYGHDAIAAVADIAKATKPGEPKGFILACLRKRAQTASDPQVAKTKLFPTKIRAFERPINPEANAQALLGWEHPLRYAADGSPVWKNGERSMIFRLRTGELKFETPPKDSVIPTLDQNPGCIVT